MTGNILAFGKESGFYPTWGPISRFFWDEISGKERCIKEPSNNLLFISIPMLQLLTTCYQPSLISWARILTWYQPGTGQGWIFVPVNIHPRTWLQLVVVSEDATLRGVSAPAAPKILALPFRQSFPFRSLVLPTTGPSPVPTSSVRPGLVTVIWITAKTSGKVFSFKLGPTHFGHNHRILQLNIK